MIQTENATKAGKTYLNDLQSSWYDLVSSVNKTIQISK
jgi:hypothetical protein